MPQQMDDAATEWPELTFEWPDMDPANFEWPTFDPWEDDNAKA